MQVVCFVYLLHSSYCVELCRRNESVTELLQENFRLKGSHSHLHDIGDIKILDMKVMNRIDQLTQNHMDISCSTDLMRTYVDLSHSQF